MEKKQNSIDWLFEQVWINPVSKLPEIFEQAKAMHKEEITDAYMVGNHSKMRGGRAILEVKEKYYNETFGGNNE
jgi:hypothetical protein